MSAKVDKHTVTGTASAHKPLHLPEDAGFAGFPVYQGTDVFLSEVIVCRQHYFKRLHIVSGSFEYPLFVVADADEKRMVFGM